VGISLDRSGEFWKSAVYVRVCNRKCFVGKCLRARNRNKSKVRARVEYLFAVVKRLWGFSKMRYRGLAKNATRSFVALGLANI
jgi:IS5 family transposase